MDGTKCLAVDPGRTTGLCYGLLKKGERLDVYPHQKILTVGEFWNLLNEFKPYHLIIEDFEFRQNMKKTGLDLYPKELIGVANLYAELQPNGPVGLYVQKAATGKAYFSNNVLKKNDQTNLS